MRQTTLLQKRVIRLINNARYNSHTDPLFRTSHLMKLTDIFEYQAALFVFDFKSNKLPVSFNDIFTFNRNMSHSRVTRQFNCLYVAQIYNVYAGKLPLFHIPRMWNRWVTTISWEVTRGHFKGQLKEHIFNSYINVINCNNPRCSECYR